MRDYLFQRRCELSHDRANFSQLSLDCEDRLVVEHDFRKEVDLREEGFVFYSTFFGHLFNREHHSHNRAEFSHAAGEALLHLGVASEQRVYGTDQSVDIQVSVEHPAVLPHGFDH